MAWTLVPASSDIRRPFLKSAAAQLSLRDLDPQARQLTQAQLRAAPEACTDDVAMPTRARSHGNSAGLPLGTMFGARFGDEATLLPLAAQLEQARSLERQIAAVFGVS